MMESRTTRQFWRLSAICRRKTNRRALARRQVLQHARSKARFSGGNRERAVCQSHFPNQWPLGRNSNSANSVRRLKANGSSRFQRLVSARRSRESTSPSWRASKHDTRFPGHEVYRFDLVLAGGINMLPPSWPTSPIEVESLASRFGLKESRGD